MQTRLTVRVDRLWIEPAKRYAESHGTTLSRLISEYLRLLSTPKLSTQETPVLHRLTGILPTDVSTDAYHKHLVEKYDV